MLQYFDTLTNIAGQALFGATLQVKTLAGANAPIYLTNSTVSPIPNSTVSADITGQVQFFVPDGVYQLLYGYQGTVYKTRSPVTMADLARTSVNVLEFGADATGLTDSATAINAACQALGPLGGTVFFPPGIFLALSSITVPPNVTLQGPWGLAGVNSPANAGYNYNILSQISLAAAATISLGSGSGIDSMLLMLNTITGPYPRSTNSDYNGTAVTFNGDDNFVRSCRILGFNQAITSVGFARPRVEDVRIDCTNGVNLEHCFDVGTFRDIICQPLLTVGGGPATHTGTAFALLDADFTVMDSCGEYGYQNGFTVTDTNNITLLNCWVDNISGNAGTVGVAWSGLCNNCKMIGGTWSWQGTGITVNIAPPIEGMLALIGTKIFNPQNPTPGTGTCLSITQGRVTCLGCTFAAAATGVTGSQVDVIACYFDTVTTPINVAGVGKELSNIRYNTYVNCTTALPDVRSINNSTVAQDQIYTFGTLGALSQQYFLARGSPAAPAAVQANDPVFGLVGIGYNGAAYVAAAEIRAIVKGTISGSAMPGAIVCSVCPAASNVIVDITQVDGIGHAPVVDNTYQSGQVGLRWSAVYSVNFTANATGLGFFTIAAAPIAQPTTGVGNAAFVVNSGTAVNTASTFDGYTLPQVVKALRNLGLLA